MILREQLFAIRVSTARQAERATIQALCDDAKRRYVRARQAGDPKAEFDVSFIGKNGFFGALPTYTGAYHPSVYKRGGGMAAGTLGKAFAYKKPQLASGGSVTGTGNDVLPLYTKQPDNSPNNDPSGGFQSAKGGRDYSW